jgi:hypothetical protein
MQGLNTTSNTIFFAATRTITRYLHFVIIRCVQISLLDRDGLQASKRSAFKVEPTALAY